MKQELSEVRPIGKPWPVAEASKFLSVGERTLWRHIKQGKIQTSRIGRRVLIPDSVVKQLAGEMPTPSNAV